VALAGVSGGTRAGAADPVLEVGQLEGLSAAVGDPRDPDRVRIGDPLVNQQPEQVLGVARFVALIGEPDVPVGAGPRLELGLDTAAPSA